MTYIVSAQVTISIYTEVDADSPGTAMEIADTRTMCGIACNSWDNPAEVWMHSGEIDGNPFNMKVEEA